jgi:hypothetical protein
MSLQCPKCGGLVYARSNSKCGHCGADLPAEFKFTEAEMAADAERVKALTKMQKPQISVLAIICWLIAGVGSGYLAIVYHRWIYWLLAIGWIGAVIERLVRYSRQRRQYDSQSQMPPNETR